MVLSHRLPQLNCSLGGQTQFGYDPNGNLLSVTDAKNQATSYTFNNMDRLATRTDPLLHAESYVYDNNGNISQFTDRKAQVTNYTYDALSRRTGVTYADASTTTYTYDTGNRLTQTVDSISGTITRTYDGLDRLTSETTPQGSVSYTYDAIGRRTSMTVAGQSSVLYSYDNANHLTQITQGSSVVVFAYDTAGRRTSLTLPNGVVVQYAYDAASRVTEIQYKKDLTVLGNLTYEYDKGGSRTKIGGSFARTGIPAAITSTSYNSGNQQTTFGDKTLIYDDNGNLTSITDANGTTLYTWNARNQLAGISAPSTNASFVYDGFGRREKKTVNGSLTEFLLDGINPAQETSGATVLANILAGSGVDHYFARTDVAAGTTNQILSDILGSTVALADSTGIVQTEYTYEPFGKTTATGTSSTNPFQFTGREYDETGLYYYRSRYYHPGLQRFISEDPIGLRSGPNLYEYAGNNPVSFSDPFGLCRDPGGSGIRYCIETFIPQAWVWGFKGDGRGPDSNGGTFRTRQFIYQGPDGNTIESHAPGTSNFWDRVTNPAIMGNCWSRTKALPLTGRKTDVLCSGSDGLLFGAAPYLDYFLEIIETAGSTQVVAAFGTGFPSIEVWQYGSGGGPNLIYHYDANAAGTGVSDLYSIVPLPLR